MKTITALMIILTFFIGGCEKFSNGLRAKPVEIAGLGSLPALARRDLSEKELTLVLETVAKQRSVNEDDARAMLEIYNRRTGYFAEGSGRSPQVENIPDKYDVEPYLCLLLQHEALRDEVRQTTEAQIIDSISGWAWFDERENGQVGSAGYLAAVYRNAYGRTIAKDDAKLWMESYDRTQSTNDAAIVAAFEQAARKYIDGERDASATQKQNAAQFVEALKIYNDSLPENAKILDAGGRLIDFRTAAPERLANIVLILYKAAGDGKNPALDKAINLLKNRMKPSSEELKAQTDMPVKQRLN